ncbi:hypothetical protein [Endozoicomonas sp.]|uniref:hypothetical protein n=1 Tax=Endozoicomonas sp. TaxID=1892382 RepID=UPI00383A1C88
MDFNTSELEDAVNRLTSSKDKSVSFSHHPYGGSISVGSCCYKVSLVREQPAFIVKVYRISNNNTLYLERNADNGKFNLVEAEGFKTTGAWRVGRPVSSPGLDLSFKIVLLGEHS